MADNLIARIILLPDGSTHIALDNSQTYVCTAVSLRDFLSDPALFKGEAYKNYKNTTQYTAPRKVSLEEIHGITLATLNSDYHLTFKFLDLFLIAFKNMNTLAQNNPINFKQYINQIHVDN